MLLYQLHESARAWMAPMTYWSQAVAKMYTAPGSWLSTLPGAQRIAAGHELLYRVGKDYEKPEFGIRKVDVDGVEVATGARRLVERLALTLQGSLMVLHSPADLAEAFVESRLGRAKGESFGTLDTGLVTLAGATALDRATATA